MFTFLVIAVVFIVIWRILAAGRHQSASEARFGPRHAPPPHTHDQGFPHLRPTHDPNWLGGGIGSTSGHTSHEGAGGSYDAPSSGGFDSSASSSGFDSSSSSGGYDGGPSGGGDYGGGGSGGSWS